MPQTTLQHSGCSVVSAVKPYGFHLRAGFRQPSPAPSPLRSVPAVRLRLTPPRSMPLCIPFRSTLSLPASSCTSGPFPPAHLSAPLPVPSRSARLNPLLPVHSRSVIHPATPTEIIHRKSRKMRRFFVFSFPRPIFVLQIRLFYSIPTHSLPTGLTNTQ